MTRPKAFWFRRWAAVNRLLSATIDQSRVLIVKGFQARGFNAELLPQRLKDRGVTRLPVYPYRDDAPAGLERNPRLGGRLSGSLLPRGRRGAKRRAAASLGG